uniref:Uncharacterized protein n=3 Tax=Enterobacteriaceae TaxID=543 RepID=J7FRL4_CITFR|nr:hypothetical protein [Citrobacter freundii]AQT23673.1 hypothetical protein [Leclercia adecarboxylata]AVA18456.1 Hypothetical protein [Citrobacter freundii]
MPKSSNRARHDFLTDPPPGRVGYHHRSRRNRVMKNIAINVSTKAPLQTVKDPVTRVSIQCTAKDEKGEDVEVNILDLEQHHTTNEIKVTFGGSPSQALTMLSRVMDVLQQQADAELQLNSYARLQ